MLVGLIRKVRPFMALKALLAVSLVATTIALQPAGGVSAEDPLPPPLAPLEPIAADEEAVQEQEGCAFPFTPTTYEGLRDRQLFLDTIELAGYNMLFPGDEFFGVPDLEVGPRGSDRATEPGKVPPILLKSIAYVESSIAQGAGDTPYGSIGPALIAFDCGHGVAQITTGMTIPEGELGRGSPEQALVATHFAYNIARGAWILADKWNEAPEYNPIAGSDTGGHPSLLENWYFAIWSYNGFTGPGANRSNHPMDPIYGSWPRTPYSCGPESDDLGHNRANYPYQELVLGCAANPPVVDDEELWQAQSISLPNLNSRTVKKALAVKNFVFPYARMDIPSPTPFHLDNTPRPDDSLREKVVGNPTIAVSNPTLTIEPPEESGESTAEAEPITQTVDIFNTGTGVLAWYATPSAPWLTVLPYTGVAVGLDYECNPGVDCDRAGHIEVSVDPELLPPDVTQGEIVIKGLGTDQEFVINVELSGVTGLAAP